jgi:hypothetical protein
MNVFPYHQWARCPPERPRPYIETVLANELRVTPDFWDFFRRTEPDEVLVGEEILRKIYTSCLRVKVRFALFQMKRRGVLLFLNKEQLGLSFYLTLILLESGLKRAYIYTYWTRLLPLL